MAKLARNPADRIIYKTWCHKIILKYGSIMNYICQERLRWQPLPQLPEGSRPAFTTKSLVPFTDTDDFRILYNDWPYGSIAPGITHLVVWSKVPIQTEQDTGYMTSKARKDIARFVDKTFTQRLRQGDADSSDRVIWFKNPVELQSVRALEHIHVLVRNVSKDVLFK